jgi:hypothetical protein
MFAIKFLLWLTLGFVALVHATVTSPSSSTVWTEGSQVQIVWQSISGSEFTLVLHRVNSAFYHTIVSYAPNTGIYTWQVDIPVSDGWPSSSASDRVYQIAFYVNGGWNNGGQLVAQSDQFAIIWGTGTAVVITAPTVIPSSDPVPVGVGVYTTVQTEVIVGAVTYTSLITAVLGGAGTLPQAPVTVLTTQGFSPATVTTFTNLGGPTTLAATTVSAAKDLISGGAKIGFSVVLGGVAGLVCVFFVFL